ncbi:hypothetical protein CVT26_008708 [Gymnopilus dilepis]|uniref:Uncharacterized protein n=1 Tax=Gymnopilus dilepis TaxID=231916 RepID=A0A409X711_9AGAR|nr:hypothetical protein CVT26_008708 [Gymnopilus dilepis]
MFHGSSYSRSYLSFIPASRSVNLEDAFVNDITSCVAALRSDAEHASGPEDPWTALFAMAPDFSTNPVALPDLHGQVPYPAVPTMNNGPPARPLSSETGTGDFLPTNSARVGLSQVGID